jgi:putative DNA primase/helicase
MRPGAAADMITKSVAVAPADTTDCPLWIQFLSEATGGDSEMIRFLQLWAGYCLTGVTREHLLVFIFGDGGTGKTVFLNALSAIMGDYAVAAPMETFTVGAFDRHPTELARLCGARLVTASETEDGRSWMESRVKQLTGGDSVPARFMRQDFFEYMPQFKIVITGNHRPGLKNVNDATRRRFRMVPFTVKPATPDLSLEERLRVEYPAILRWMIDGCKDWQASGLPESATIRKETDEYFAAQDVVGQWINDCCESDMCECRINERSSLLFKSWRNYAITLGEEPRSNKWLSEKLESRGYTKRKTRDGIEFMGIRTRR